MLLWVFASAEISVRNLDISEGGHLDTDFSAGFIAEWWYLNGQTVLVSSDGEKKDIPAGCAKHNRSGCFSPEFHHI
jgi:hypothetical protein